MATGESPRGGRLGTEPVLSYRWGVLGMGTVAGGRGQEGPESGSIDATHTSQSPPDPRPQKGQGGAELREARKRDAHLTLGEDGEAFPLCMP